ncbi:MAG: sigma-70 family RNA polymerase sigma factor [Gemmataceae bacterium]|nr:sigma-70 family RNA polymerase sigma factor [Gemmataceae bacterium]
MELLQSLQKPLEVYCRRLLRNPSLVEDVLQSAITAAFAAFDLYAEGTNFRAWIFRFVTLEAFNRNRKHESVSLDEVPTDLAAEESWGLVAQEAAFNALLEDPDTVLEHFDDAVVGALEKLSAVERSVLLLRAVGEFSYQEIHELLTIPLGSVIGYLSRARKRMQLALADYAGQHGLLPEEPSSEGPES